MKFNPKKVWKRVFTPRCFGEKEKLLRCCKIYLIDRKIPCEIYFQCLREGIRKQELGNIE